MPPAHGTVQGRPAQKCQRAAEVCLLLLAHVTLLACASVLLLSRLGWDSGPAGEGSEECDRRPIVILWSLCSCSGCDWRDDNVALKVSWWLYAVGGCMAGIAILMMDVCTYEPRIQENVAYGRIITALLASAGILMIVSLILYVETPPISPKDPSRVEWAFPVAWVGVAGLMFTVPLGLCRTWKMMAHNRGFFRTRPACCALPEM